MRCRLLIVCDVRVFREGLERSLRRHDSLEVAGTAASGSEALDHLRAHGAELVLLDMSAPLGVDTIAAIAREMADVKLLALGVDEEPQTVMALIEAGAAGYVPRDASLRDLIESLEAVARGETLCSPRITSSLFRRVASLTRQHDVAAPVCGLTEREREILALVEQGTTNKQIARVLKLKLPTVKHHVHSILEKLGVSNRGAAAAVARNGRRPAMAAWSRNYLEAAASNGLALDIQRSSPSDSRMILRDV